MNPKDYDNLNFIMSLNPEELKAWWDDMDDVNRNYALSVVQCYNIELQDYVQDEDDTSIAKNYLKKFML